MVQLLASTSAVTDLVTLQGAILHDTVEDTDTSPEELTALFGPEVQQVVNW